MVFRKRKTYRKKTYRKKKAPIKNAILKQKSAIVTFKYSDTITINPAVSDIPTFHDLRATSIYDPDLTGTGHQPKGHDELAGFFQKYTVLSSSVNISASALKTGNPMMIGVYRVEDGAPVNLTSKIDMLESSVGRTKYLGVDGIEQKLRIGYNKSKQFKNTQNPNLTANFGANPVEDTIFRIGCVNKVYLQAPSPVQLGITMYFKCLLTERLSLGQS